MIDAFLCFFIMFKIRLYCLLLIILCATQISLSQDSYSTPSRTPEQEAAFLTEKMKKDLYLTSEQSQAIYEINLRYARERKVETSRIKALERVRLKENEIQQVLTAEQISRMQEKRINRNPSVNPSESREYTTQPQNRQPQPGNSYQPYDRNMPAPTYYRADRQPSIPGNNRSSASENTARTQSPTTTGSQPRAASPSSSGSQNRAAVPSSSGGQPRAVGPSSSGSQPRAIPPASSGNQTSGNRSTAIPERSSGSGSGSTRR
jgi:hypothetical protein